MKDFVINLINSFKGNYTKVEFLNFILKSFILHVKIWRARMTLFGQCWFVALLSSIKSQPLDECPRSQLKTSSWHRHIRIKTALLANSNASIARFYWIFVLPLQFAISQYSTNFRTHFYFNTFNTNLGWENGIRQIVQYRSGTQTASAIRNVV